MVKPPRTMQPESVDLKKSVRAPGKAFQDDSFHSYMARKISLQRQQFGLLLPPAPLELLERESATGQASSVDGPEQPFRPVSLHAKIHLPTTIPNVDISIKNKNSDELTTTKNSIIMGTKKRKRVSFAPETSEFDTTKPIAPTPKIKTERKSFGFLSVLKSLKKKYGKITSREHEKLSRSLMSTVLESDFVAMFSNNISSTDCVISSGDSALCGFDANQSCDLVSCGFDGNQLDTKLDAEEIMPCDSSIFVPETMEESEQQTKVGIYSTSITSNDHTHKSNDTNGSSTNGKISRQLRPDLFFLGVVVLVNGYTDPDVDTIQRLLHMYGGDLERYETSRVSHIIAEHLSFAKAKMYKRQRNPKPVVYPKWILDSVEARKLLPYSDYIIEEMRDTFVTPLKSIASFFGPQEHNEKPQHESMENRGKDVDSNKLTPTTRHIEGKGNERSSYISAEQYSGNFLLNDNIRQVSDEESPNNSTDCSFKVDVRVDDRSLGATKGLTPLLGINDTPERNERIRLLAEQRTMCSVKEGTSERLERKIRTVGTDPNFLESFFAASRLSFIGSYNQRSRQDLVKKVSPLHSDSMNYQMFVLHVDLDCFFASVVLRNYPEYRNKPVAIAHQGIKRKSDEDASTRIAARKIPKDSSSECATCNYEARKFGVKKGMFLGRAKALCPDLIVLQYDFDGYEEVSEQFTTILDRYASEFSGFVEHVSCDEAYMELHITENDLKSSTSLVQEIAESIRLEIFEVTQCTATVGVSTNKLLAKLATDRVKPNKSHVSTNYLDLLHPLKLSELHGIGYRLKRKLSEAGLEMVQDVWDLGDKGETKLCKILGPGLGKKIYGFCHGRDERTIQPAIRKTIGAECSYGVRFDGPYGVDHMIRGLAREVEKRMMKVGVKGSQITLKVKQRKAGALPPPKFLGHGSCNNISKSQATPNSVSTRCNDVIAEVASQILNDLRIDKDEIRGMGIIISKLTTDSTNIDYPLDGQTKLNEWYQRKPPVEDVSDYQARGKASESNDCSIVGKTRKLDDECVSHEMEIDLDDSSSASFLEDDEVVVLEPQIVSVVATTSPANNDEHDIEVPTLSQLHMSQVHALPMWMRRQIESKLMSSSKLIESHLVPKVVEQLNEPPVRLLQTDVKRMLQLASVKSGKVDLQLHHGESVSLTQLNRLPLKLQLQVANSDQKDLGDLIDVDKRRIRILSRVATVQCRKTHDDMKGTTSTANHSEASQVEYKGTVNYVSRVPTPLTPINEGKGSFFQNNILPLHSFLDGQPCDDHIIEKVVTFLSCRVDEGGINDVVILFRSLRNRSDHWSASGFNRIFYFVNAFIENKLGYSLDKEWL